MKKTVSLQDIAISRYGFTGHRTVITSLTFKNHSVFSTENIIIF